MELTELKSLLAAQKISLIDVREPTEWKGGCVNGAVLHPLGQLMLGQAPKVLDKNLPVYTYCHSGVRSITAVPFLQAMGFNPVVGLKQGIAELQAHGFEIYIPN